LDCSHGIHRTKQGHYVFFIFTFIMFVYEREISKTNLSICSLFHLIVDLGLHVVEEIGMLDIYLQSSRYFRNKRNK
jgi:hypothetical protein